MDLPINIIWNLTEADKQLIRKRTQKNRKYKGTSVEYHKSNYTPFFAMEEGQVMEETSLPIDIMDHIFGYLDDNEDITASRQFQSTYIREMTYYLSFGDFFQSCDGTLSNFRWLLKRKDGHKNLNTAFGHHGLFFFHRQVNDPLMLELIDSLTLDNLDLFRKWATKTYHHHYLKLFLETKKVVYYYLCGDHRINQIVAKYTRLTKPNCRKYSIRFPDDIIYHVPDSYIHGGHSDIGYMAACHAYTWGFENTNWFLDTFGSMETKEYSKVDMIDNFLGDLCRYFSDYGRESAFISMLESLEYIE